MPASVLNMKSFQLPCLIPAGTSTNPVSRAFQLLAGESINIRGIEDCEDHLFLMLGKIRIDPADGSSVELDKNARAVETYPIPHTTQLTVTALENSAFYHVDQEKLSYLNSINHIKLSLGNEKEDRIQILHKLVNSAALRNLPLYSLYELVDRMTIRTVTAGEEIVKQGEQGREFYYIDTGHAEVWQTGLYDDEAQLVRTLGEGDAFGEYAVVTSGTRNATVKMIENGILYVAQKEDYMELVMSSQLKEVDAEIAKAMLDKEHVLLDVRYEEEHDDSYIPGSQLMPLHELRNRVDELDKNKHYIAYCRSGRRSAVAAIILHQYNIDAASLSGGINAWPYETKSNY